MNYTLSKKSKILKKEVVMQVKEIMSKKPDYIDPEFTLKDAADEMFKKDIGFLPIGDKEKDRLIGVITDRDITLRGVAKGKDPKKTLVKDVMTRDVLYCFEDENIEKVADNMCKNQIRRLIVLNKDKRITGIISLGDLALKNKDEWLAGHTLHEVCSTSH